MNNKLIADNLIEFLDYFDENDIYLGTLPRKRSTLENLFIDMLHFISPI
jgi:hypothetical protein